MPTETLRRSPTAPSARGLHTAANRLGRVRLANSSDIEPRNKAGDMVNDGLAPVNPENVVIIVGVTPHTTLGKAVSGVIPRPLPMRDGKANLGQRRMSFDLAYDHNIRPYVVDLVEDKSPQVGIGVVSASCMAPPSGEGVNDVGIVRVEVDPPIGQRQSDIKKENVQSVGFGSNDSLQQPR
jgi:hypothetical protein